MYLQQNWVDASSVTKYYTFEIVIEGEMELETVS